VSANRVSRIHPASHPSHDILTGHRGGQLGYWRGPDIEVTGVQQVNPHVSRDIAKQWLIDEGEVVDARVFREQEQELLSIQAELDQAEAAVQQLKNRLGRVYPRRPRNKKVKA
jgi:hypothetical protein